MVNRVVFRSDPAASKPAWTPEEDLSSAAVDAALELDRLTAGRSIDQRPVSDLARRIQAPFLERPGVPRSAAYIDSSFVFLLDSAIRESAYRKQVQTVEELRTLAEHIRKDLAGIAGAAEGASFSISLVAKLRDFCLVLARSARSLEPRTQPDEE